MGQFRLLEVDNPLILPINTHIRLIVTANDVIHSFSMPSLGLKIDAIPGRLNQISLIINRLGSFYGNCTELCGVNHAFMPININSVKISDYIDFISSES
jgi:cytochrome c oxidase subunit 2